MKGCTRDELLKAIRRAAAGKNAWNRRRRRGVGPATRTHRIGTLEASLSKRQGEVLRQIADGLNNEQIAMKMNVDCDTVKKYVTHILQKLCVTDRTQAALWAIRNGLVSGPTGRDRLCGT